MANTPDLTKAAACGCGLQGELNRLSPDLLNGGNTRHRKWSLQSSNSDALHLGQTDWCDDCQRYETTCHTTGRKTGC